MVLAIKLYIMVTRSQVYVNYGTVYTCIITDSVLIKVHIYKTIIAPKRKL